MHAVSPQMMVWEPSSIGIPIHSTDLQHSLLAPTSGYPVVVQPQPYRSTGCIPHVLTSATIPNHQEVQNVVWIQAPNVVAHEDNDANPGILNQPYHTGSLAMHTGHQGVVPVVVNVNGQRLLVNQPVHHFAAAPQPSFCQLSTEQQPNEGIHLVNVSVNSSGHNLASVTQEFRPSVSLSSLPDSQAIAYSRPRLVPKRRNGNMLSPCDNAVSWRNISDDRTLGIKINTALRRRSQSTEDGNIEAINSNVSGSPSPNKKLAPTTSNLEADAPMRRRQDPRQLRKLLDIIEYYFSDECLSKNGYMLKQLSNGDCDGYISIRRVAALKRVKAQTRDLGTVAQAVGLSTKLELDKDGLMIRRKRPLPENIEAPRFIRSVLAINLPTEAPTVENVTSLFKRYGELTQVRVLRPGKAIPSYLKDYTAWVADLGTRVCAVIEFENQDEAQKACREINMQNRGDNSLRVALLKPGARIRRTLYRKYKDEPADVNAEANESYGSSSNASSSRATSRDRRHSESSSDENSQTNITVPENKTIPINKGNSTFHYDASGSGSDTDSDETKLDGGNRSVDASECQRSAFLDSGYSQSSSSDEIDSSQSSPTINRKSAISEIERSDKMSDQVPRSLERNFVDGVPIGAARQPKGPEVDSTGFTRQRPVQD